MEFLTEWINPAAMVLALVVGFCVKSVSKSEGVNRIIPTICALVGVAVCVATDIAAGDFGVYSVVIGAMSGLSATGLFEMVRNWLDKGDAKIGGTE